MSTNEQFIFGGYYLIKRSNIDMNSIKISFSLDENICSIYPSEWAMSGYQCPKNYKKEIMNELKLNKVQFLELQHWVDMLFKEHKFGISNVFSDIESAREFNRRYLKGVQGIKLIGIGIPKKYLSQFFIDNGIFTEHYEEHYEGVLSNLSKMIPMDKNGKGIGYEILGYLSGGFYSIWTVVDANDLNRLNLQFNEFGLIQNLELAEGASTRINSEKMSSEEVYWVPWNLYEFNL